MGLLNKILSIAKIFFKQKYCSNITLWPSGILRWSNIYAKLNNFAFLTRNPICICWRITYHGPYYDSDIITH